MSVTANAAAAADNFDSKTTQERSKIFVDLIAKFMSLYKSLSIEQLNTLQLHSYDKNQLKRKKDVYDSTDDSHKFNVFLVQDGLKLHFNNIIKDKSLYTALFDIKKLINPKYKHLAAYIEPKQEMVKMFIEDYINKLYVAPINMLTNIFKKSTIPHHYLDADTVLYKGLRQCFIANKNVGDEVIFENFVAATLSKQIAKNLYTHRTNKDKVASGETCMCMLTGLGGVQYIFVLDKPKPYTYTGDKLEAYINAAFVESSDQHAQAFQYNDIKFTILLQRNIKFRITKISHITAEYKSDNDNSVLKGISYKAYMDSVNVNGTIKLKTKKNKPSHKPVPMIRMYHLEFVEQMPVARVPHWKMPSDFKLSL